MESDSPKVSIITAAYNAEKYIDGCITSVLSQNYKNFEYIIIDGGSTDNTLSIIRQYEHKLAYWVSEPDRGIYDAWNKGLSAAKGEWIAFLGSDDLLYPDAIQTYIDHITQHPKQHQLEFVSSHIELVKQDLTSIRIVGEAWNWERFKYKMITWHVGCFHAKHLFTKYGNFDPIYKVSGDYELLLRPKDQLAASFINHTTVRMRLGGVSDTKLIEAHDETFRAKIKNGAITAWRGEILKILYHLYLTMKFAIKR